MREGGGEEEPDLRLKYQPPDYSNYTVINVPATGSGTNGRFIPPLNSSTDYVINLPSQKRTGVVRIEGGRNIVIIGGEIERAVEGGGYQDQDRRCLYFLNNTGNIYVEGVHFHINGSNNPFDAIYVHNTQASASSGQEITIQNCLFENVLGSFTGFHSDAFQMQDSSYFNGTIRFYRNTITTDYQGYYALHEGTSTVTYIEKTNYVIVAESGACLWFGDNGNDYWSRRHTVLGEGVYLQTARTLFDQVRPNEECVIVNERPVLSNGVMTWPNSSYITGSLIAGTPLEGNYVTSDIAGHTYVSPGYII